MPYDATKDVNQYPGPTLYSLARIGRAVSPSDTVDLDPYAKGVVCLTSGNISIIPTKNADGATVDFVGVSAGFIPPFQVRRVMQTGTTCTVAAAYDV